jgi:hypothetical protein
MPALINRYPPLMKLQAVVISIAIGSFRAIKQEDQREAALVQVYNATPLRQVVELIVKLKVRTHTHIPHAIRRTHMHAHTYTHTHTRTHIHASAAPSIAHSTTPRHHHRHHHHHPTLNHTTPPHRYAHHTTDANPQTEPRRMYQTATFPPHPTTRDASPRDSCSS